MIQNETIVCSAVQFNGLDIGGRRHKDCYTIIRAIAPTFKDEDIDRSKQGFITSTGRFVDRKEAWIIAEREGQILYGYAASDKGADSELISENLFADAEDMPVETDKTNEILINWLTEEYTREDAEEQIRNAEITKQGNTITIKYGVNNAVDIVKIIKGKVIHLNPIQ